MGLLGATTDADGRYAISIPSGEIVALGTDRPATNLSTKTFDGTQVLTRRSITRARNMPSPTRRPPQRDHPPAHRRRRKNPSNTRSRLATQSFSPPHDSVAGQHRCPIRAQPSMSAVTTYSSPQKPDQLDLHTASPAPAPAGRISQRSSCSPVPPHQAQTITLPAQLRWKPLDGRLIDPAGKPVANAEISPVNLMVENSRSMWRFSAQR